MITVAAFKILMNLIGSVAQFEREMMLERVGIDLSKIKRERAMAEKENQGQTFEKIATLSFAKN